MAGNIGLFQPEQCGSVVKCRHSHSDSTAPIFTPSIPGGQGRQTGTVEAVSAQHFKLWGQRQLFQSMIPGKRAHIRHDLIRGVGQIAQSLQLLWQMDAGKAAAVTEYTGRQGGNGIRQGDGAAGRSDCHAGKPAAADRVCSQGELRAANRIRCTIKKAPHRHAKRAQCGEERAVSPRR